MGALRRLAAAAIAAGLAGILIPAPGAAPVAAAPHARPVAAVPAAQKVYIVAESVGLSAGAALPAAFPPGWQVTVDGTPALFVEQLEQKHVRARMATSSQVFGDYAVVAAGHNYPYWDPARFDRSVDAMIETLRAAGVRHIFWVTLREVKPQFVTSGAWREAQPFAWYLPIVNVHLRAALQRHPDLTLIDWAAVADRPGLTYDAIHLNTTGAAAYAELVARTVQQVATRRPAGSVEEIDVTAAGAPADAAAIALNLTVTGARDDGFLTAYPCGGDAPEVSSLNFRRDQTVAAAAIVPVGAGGKVCVRTSEATQLIVDATGWFPAGAGFRPAAPARAVDTRSGGRQPAGVPLEVPVASMAGIPADPAAVALNVTATDAAAAGYVTVHPCGTARPPTSNLNVPAGGTAPNVVVAAPGASGTICVVPSVDTHLLVDVFGSFAGDAVEVPPPGRAFDSRARGHALAAGETVRVPVGGTTGGTVLNLTATGASSEGYVTAFPCDVAMPPSSNLNVRTGVDVANVAVVRPSAEGEVCVSSSGPTHVVVDVMGSLGAAFTGIAPVRLVDSRA